MPQQLHSADFVPQLHTTFQVAVNPDPIPIELFEIEEKNDSPKVEQFSLLFRGPLAPILAQRVHRLTHHHLGELEIFLVPIGPDSAGMRYEAVFNRIRQPE